MQQPTGRIDGVTTGGSVRRRIAVLADLVPLAIALPPAALGIGWLIAVTPPDALRAAAPELIGLLMAGYAFYRVRFVYTLAPAGSSPLYAQLTLWPLLVWGATLALGPVALWAALVWPLVRVSLLAPDEPLNGSRRVVWLAALAQNAAALVLPALGGLWLSDWLRALLPALSGPLRLLLAGVPLALLPALLLAALFGYINRGAATDDGAPRTAWRLAGRVAAVAALVYLPALLARGGTIRLLLFAGGAWLVNYVLADLRRALALRTRQAERLTLLEQLAATLLNAPLDFDDWQPLLGRYLPLLFAHNPLHVRLLPDHVIYANGDAWVETTVDIGQVLAATSAPFLLAPVALRGQPDAPLVNAIVYPLRAPADGAVLGGMVLVPRHAGGDSAGWLPTLRVVAGQLAAAVQHVYDYRQMLDYQAQLYQQELYAQAVAAEAQQQRAAYDQLAREMALARDIQLTLLPRFAPDVDGWDLSVTFEPAGEASGDFYDFIQLPDGRLGLLIADVAGKGMGSALYMALSKTLLRAFALEQGATPARVLAHANERMVADTQGEWMVTVFYGVLDPVSGELHYANAGHHPPLLWTGEDADGPQLLLQSGMPMGIFGSAQWQERHATLGTGGTLVLYTDGITEAFNEASAVFGEARLIAAVDENLGRPAAAIEARVIRAVEQFVGQAAQSDDMALIVIVRD